MSIRYITEICPIPIGKITFEETTKNKIIQSLNNISIIDDYITKNGQSDFLTHFYNDKNILLDYQNLNYIKNLFENEASVYYKEVMGYDSDVNVHQSWINICEEKGHQGFHYHSNSVISGTFYFSYDKNTNPPLLFLEPGKVLEDTGSLNCNIIVDNRVSATNWCKDYWTVEYEEGDMLLWPSYLRHGYINNLGPIRKSLSFNCFPKKLNNLYGIQ